MQFNPADGTGVIDEINDICNSDNNSYPIASKTRRVNAALDRFFTLAFEADGRWSFEDNNQTGTPIQNINIVSGTSAYDLDAFTSEIINVLRFEITDADGKRHLLNRVDGNSVSEAIPSFEGEGTPRDYILLGKQIILSPEPNYSSTGGLTVYMERNKVSFTSVDTTKELGIPSIFHQYICRTASLPYLIELQKSQKNDIASQCMVDEQAILRYFNNREKGVKKTLTPRIENTR